MHHIWIVHCENDLKTVLILIASRYLCMLRFILIDMSHPSSLFKTFSKERNIYNLLIKCKQNWLKFILQQLSKKHGLDYWKSKKVYMYKLHSITVYIYIYLQKNTAVFCYSIFSIQRVGHMKYSQNSARIPKWTSF